MPYIIGTAGHIDHGKTSLIKALTGQDTDRLKEEKERGISIDLGFAYLDLPDGTQAGIVDVPGHERFIRNMLAGAHGMDLVLFTVAADDGIMPQTEEHLDILHLLGVKMAIFVITKADLVPPAKLQEVEEDIRILTLGTALENFPVVSFSAVTGAGLAELREKIFATLQSCAKTTANAYFRLPVDRVFILQGHGLIVTGTALGGKVSVGDRVRCLPGGQIFRVRSVQVHNHAVDSATSGQRTALNLGGQESVALERGHVICHEKITLVSDRFDAFVDVRPAAKKGIKSHQRVRVHLGTAERLGKIIVLDNRGKAEPKESVYCQVTTSEPILAMRGDRFIVRDETARRTLAGGVVLHPWATRHKKNDPDLETRLATLRNEDISRLLESFLESNEDFATPREVIHQFLNLTEEECQSRIDRSQDLLCFTAEGEKLYTTEKKWKRLKEKTGKVLQDFHAAHTLAPGMDMEELRGKLPHGISQRLFRELIELLTAQKIIARDGNFVRLPGHKIELHEEAKALSEKILHVLERNPSSPPDLKQIEKELGIRYTRVSEVARVMERQGAIARVATDLYFLKSYVDKVKGLLYTYCSAHGEISAATFRDLIGSSRKYAIGLLEYFDREGITTRVGDIRRLRLLPPSGSRDLSTTREGG